MAVWWGYRCADSGSGQATTRAEEVVNRGANLKLLLLLIVLLCFQVAGATGATAAAAATAGAAAGLVVVAAVVFLVLKAALAAAGAVGCIRICGGVEYPRPAVEWPWSESGRRHCQLRGGINRYPG